MPRWVSENPCLIIPSSVPDSVNTVINVLLQVYMIWVTIKSIILPFWPLKVKHYYADPWKSWPWDLMHAYERYSMILSRTHTMGVAERKGSFLMWRIRVSVSLAAVTACMEHCKWGLPSASDPRAKNTGQRATKGTVLTSQSLSPWCDCRRLGSTLASWRWQDINVGNPLWRRALLQRRLQWAPCYDWDTQSSNSCCYETVKVWC